MTVLRERQTWTKDRKSKRERYTDGLTPEEQACIRVALAVLRIRYGTLRKLAVAMHTTYKTLVRMSNKSGKPTAGIAIRAARLAGVPIDDVLSGNFPKAGSCPLCGRCE
jgi:hypothetical protein